MDLTIVIPTYRGAARLPDTLGALARATPPVGGAEAIVVDDGSPDPPSGVDAGAGSRLEVSLVRLETNRGRAAACNAGLARARGRVVLILDDDMSVGEAALTGHVGAHDASVAPRGVLGRIEPDPASFRGPYGRFLAEEERARQARLAASADDVPIEDCFTGFFSAPRTLLEEAGGYDEAFARYGFEDLELAWRLRERGAGVCYRAGPLARHRSAAVSFREHCRRHVQSGAMAVLFAQKHGAERLERHLRVRGMPWRDARGAFMKTMAAAHALTRATPLPLHAPLLAGARATVAPLEWLGPRRARHAAYHVVRDMHYASGIARARRGR